MSNLLGVAGLKYEKVTWVKVCGALEITTSLIKKWGGGSIGVVLQKSERRGERIEDSV